nr:hypothetical protein [Pseudomonas aeruginosa]
MTALIYRWTDCNQRGSYNYPFLDLAGNQQHRQKLSGLLGYHLNANGV